MAAGEEQRRQAVLARIARVRSRLNLEISLRAAVVPAWLAATAFVLWRVFVQRGELVFGGVALLAVVVATWWLSRKRGVSDESAAVLADKGAGAGGLLLTRLERPVGEWELGLNQSLHALKLPEIEVRRPVALLLLAVCFIGAGLLVPKRKTVTPPPNAAAATRVEELAEKMDAVAKEEPLSDAAKQELERLKEELADNTFDAADWESADALEQQLDKQAAEASRELDRAEDAAKQLQEALAQAGEGESTSRQQDELERALMELSDGNAQNAEQAMQQALGENGEQGENGQQQNGQQGQQGQQGQNGQQGQQGQQDQNGQQQNDQQQNDQQRQNGQQGQNGQQQQNGQSGQQGKSNSGQQNRVNELQRALSQRRNQLSKPFGGAPPQQTASKAPSQKPGNGQGQNGSPSPLASRDPLPTGEGNSQGHASRGMEQGEGVSRGGDSAELVFGGEAEMDPNRLAFEALPEGNGGEAGELRGLRAANPRVKEGVAVTNGSGANAAGEGAAGWGEAPMRPRNRALVEKYFNSK